MCIRDSYGVDGVTAVARVELDYDKMKTETRQLTPEDTGKGVMTHFEEQFSQNGQVAAEGLVGEENNTDVPKYPNQVGAGDGTTSDYSNSIDYDLSLIHILALCRQRTTRARALKYRAIETVFCQALYRPDGTL